VSFGRSPVTLKLRPAAGTLANGQARDYMAVDATVVDGEENEQESADCPYRRTPFD
jgi:hypothetical protein